MHDTDYIIVGSGSAGSVLADRLSAIGRHRVTVLEAGGTDRRFYVHLPLGYGKLFYDPAVNWCYRDRTRSGAGRAPGFLAAGQDSGRVVRRSMRWSISGAIGRIMRSGAADNPGWGWDDCLAAYKAMEDNEAGGDDWRGKGGPLVRLGKPQGAALAGRGLYRGLRAGGAGLQPRFQRGGAGGRGHLSDDDQGRAAEFGGAGVSAAGDGAAQPGVVTRAHGDAGADRGRPGGRGRVCAGRRDAGAALQRRGDPGGRGDQLAAAVATVGGRAGGAVAGLGDRGGAGQSECRRPSERPSGHQLYLGDECADLQRHPAAVVGQAVCAGRSIC